jgi:hypothetical protein
MAQRLTRTTFTGERKESGEGDSGSLARLCRVRGASRAFGEANRVAGVA